MSEAAALTALAAALVAAIVRPPRLPDWVVAGTGALVLVLSGVLSAHGAHRALTDLGPTVGFLAALLILADGCAAEGLFQALGAAMARGAHGAPRRLLAMVFVCGAATTAVLSLDATVLLLTPVVFATAARLRVSARPHTYACSHLANSASLLLPVSNLTNLLADRASGLAFAHFAALMVLPWLAALAVEWAVFMRFFASSLRAGDMAEAAPVRDVRLPRVATSVLALTLAGFAASSAIGIDPAWVAAAGAAVFVVRRRRRPHQVLASAQPGFLVFVLALGIVVRAAGDHGLSHLITTLLPSGTGILDLWAIAGVSAIAANLLNNLPATLILLPVVAVIGPGAVLAMLVGVGIGPNLTYVGSLATLLWRRVLRAHDETSDTGDFVRLGLLTVPAGVLASTAALWLALQL